MNFDYDLIVLGSGSAGGSAALAARALGKKVAVVENYTLGGECPNYACVPTKALLRSAEIYSMVKGAEEFGILADNVRFDYAKVKARKDKVVGRTGAVRAEKIFKSNEVSVIWGEAKFTGKNEIEAGGKKYTAEKFVIATGTKTFIPPVEGLEQAGYLTNEQAIDLTELPATIGIMGGGPVGCEFAEIFSIFGAKVFIFEKNLRVIPREDEEVGMALMEKFAKQGVEFVGNVMVSKVEKAGEKRVVTVSYDSGETKTYEVDELLVAAGKRPAIDTLNLEAAGVEYDKKGVKVDETLKTTADHIYAAGDVVGPYLFTHTAHYQGDIAGRNAFSDQKEKASSAVVPRCVYTEPEVASVGLGEPELKEKGISYKVGKFPIDRLGKANATERMEGFVKIFADASSDKILGGAIYSPNAGEMIHEIALAMYGDVTAQKVAEMIHAYPTFSEAVRAAAGEASYGEPVHSISHPDEQMTQG